MTRRIAKHLWFAIAIFAVDAARAQSVARLIEEVGTSEQPGYVAVTVLFGCGMRYVGHTPATSGDTVRIRLTPLADCGSHVSAGAVPPTLDDVGVIRSVDVDTTLGSTVELVLRWKRVEEFVLVPSIDGRALKLRLLRNVPERGGEVNVQEAARSTSAFAVNLDSSRSPFDAPAVAAAAQRLDARVYVSEANIDGATWYRLRAGPFITEADARKVLLAARPSYPRAWVAVGDDETLTAPGSPGAPLEIRSPQKAPAVTMTAAETERAYGLARDAFRRKDYAVAIPLLTQLTDQPEYPQRADAQEMLALAHERNGELAHAKAEYEDYLQRYPDSPAAGRIRQHLQALLFAASPAGARSRLQQNESPWRVLGGVSQLYRRDNSSFDDGVQSSDVTTQDALLTDVGLVARRHGERFDFATRVSAGYTLDLMTNGPGDQGRVTAFYAELADRELAWTVRAGRQTGSTGALIGTFDGIYLGYQLLPQLRLNAHAGYPVDTTTESPSTDWSFYALSADFGPYANAWDGSLYVTSQSYYGLTNREAVGGEIRYFQPGRTFVALVDYDLHFKDLNDALLIGTIELPSRWTLALNLDHRKSPTLGVRNAMIGQPVQGFDELFGLYSNAELDQLAVDRTADTSTYTLSVSRPIGERWQWSLDLSSLSFGSTPASGGVEATPDPGTDVVVATQALGYGLFGHGDVESLGLRYQTGDTFDSMSLGLGSQFPIGNAWRLSPRVRVDRRTFNTDNSTETVVAPGLRAELRWGHFMFELEGGAELGRRALDSGNQDTNRYYVSLGYRYDF